VKPALSLLLAALQLLAPALATAASAQRVSVPSVALPLAPLAAPSAPVSLPAGYAPVTAGLPVPAAPLAGPVSLPAAPAAAPAAPAAAPSAARVASPLGQARLMAAEAGAPAQGSASAPSAGAPAPGASAFDGSAAEGRKASPLPELPPEPSPWAARRYRLARALVSPALKLFYRVRASGVENLPAGAAVVVPNHISYVDALLLSYAADRPMRYILFKGIYDKAPRLFDALGAIPVASPKDGGTKESIELALARARAAVKNGETVVIFPEGALTKNGNMAAFKRGFERIIEGLEVPVVPAHLDNLWGSYFSRKGNSMGAALQEVPRSIGVRFGAPLEKADAQAARDAVQQLSAEALESRIRRRSATLPRSFFRMAKRRWSKPAVTDSTGVSLTYGRALAATTLLAGALTTALSPARRVGVLLPPSVGGTLANTALSAAGRVPVNLNYTASAEAVEHALKVSGIDTVLTSRKVVETLKKKGAALPDRPYVYIEDLLAAQPKWKQTLRYLALRLLPTRLAEAVYLRQAPRSLDDEATIVFTSGSTALPKGVVLTHLNLQSNVRMVTEAFKFEKTEVMLGVLPFFHSFGLTISLWFPLLRGLSAAYHSHPLEMDSIAKLALRARPTVLLGTPTFLQRYTDKIPVEAFRTLKDVIAGAEKLRPEVADAFKAKFGARPLEGYGSTELSPVAAVSVPDSRGQKGFKDGSVGQNLPGTAIKVVDPETWKELPYGRQGLLLVKGPHVMKGYLNEPRKTAEVLKDGWYVTGDVAVVDKDGFIFLKGRWGSRFSKIAGEMVPHEGVEDKLHKAAGLAEQTFVVTAVPDDTRGERLVVLYTKFDGDINALLTKARAQGLPGVWTPSAASFYKVDAFPVLGTGKLDLKALKELAQKLAGAK
jgi:acyl-[acyl-carrier-protein]-phospholipid O-acyltransferase/long-chain-fatty-acid--[acyl-carrier-protein] ligase